MLRMKFGLYMLLGALAVGAVAAPAALAVQASGSIVLVPSKQTGIEADQEITVDVYFNNQSTQTPNPVNPGPPPPAPPVPVVAPPLPNLIIAPPNPATVTGPITIDLCADGCPCNQPVPDGNGDGVKDLVFVPGPAAGCDAKAADVVSCAAVGTSSVVVNLPVGGIGIPDATPKYLATIRFKNTVPSTGPFTGQLGPVSFQASIGMCALASCRTSVPPPNGPGSDCTFCSAEGCSFVRGATGGGNVLSCKHGCKNRIDFFPAQPADPDKTHLNFIVQKPGYDPANETFRLTVTKGAVTIFDTGLLPGIPVSGTVWETPNVPPVAGNQKIEIHQLGGTGKGGIDCTVAGYFKIIVDAWGNFDAARMVDPTLEVRIELGGTAFTTGQRIWNSLGPAGNISAVTFDFPTTERSPC